jgi:2-dehydropantoate 2-reductase
VARPRIAEELGAFGLHLTDLAGLDSRLPPGTVDVRTSADCLTGADIVILAVKSGDTPSATDVITALTAPGVPVVSLQNGVENPTVLRARLGQSRVLGGMVGFNVVHKGEGRFHRGTSGNLVIEQGRPDIIRLLSVPGLEVTSSANIAGVQWGKLIVNLNNALNALSNLPLRQQLEDRAWRRVLADQIAEAVAILAAAKIKTVPATKAPPRLIPPMLRLPNALFRIAARPMLRVDPEARSSMWEDLMRRRPTEVDHLQGAIVRLARDYGLKAPLSERILALVKEAEANAAGPPGISPRQICRRLQ